MFPKFTKEIKKSNHILICKVFADGAYESNVVFKCLVDNGMLPYILAKKNAEVKNTHNTFRNLSTMSCKK